MLKSVMAEFACDKCGELFSVSIDAAYTAPAEWSQFDVAVDAIRGGLGYVGPGEVGWSCGVLSDRHLCAVCMNKADHPKEEDGSAVIRILCACGHDEAEVTGWEDGEAIEGECLKCGASVNLTDE